jgi:hypothetical protein
MASLSKGTSFTDGVTGDVTAAKLAALVDAATPVQGFITDRTAETTVASDDVVLVSDTSAAALRKMTVANLFAAPLTGTVNSTAGTITALTTGTGTAAAPAIAPTGDTNTGIFFPAADTIAFGEGGAEAVRIDSSGNVGVGNTVASTIISAAGLNNGSLVVGSGSGQPGVVIYGGASNTSSLFFADGTTGADTFRGYVEYNHTDNFLRFGSNTNERLRIDSSGNVTLTSNKSLISRGAGGVGTNSAIGDGALQANTTGLANTANGYQALYNNTTGHSNTANGYIALYNNNTGVQNAANGYEALFSNTTGYNNTANGFAALRQNISGNNNTANGYAALFNNTGSNNTANGYQALYNNTANNNTANGYQALYNNTTGIQNTANGVNALFNNNTGHSNTSLGFQAGYGTGTNGNTTGTNNTFIGNEAVGTSSTASNVITLGNGSIATLRCQVTTITGLSDRRDKKDITPLSSGLGLVNLLKPVSFVWDTRDRKKVDVPAMGFIAQDLQEAQAQSGLSVPNLVLDDNPDKLEAAPAALIPVLVRAVQELSEKVSQLEAKPKD